MAQSAPWLNNWANGEVSPKFFGRFDVTEKYNSSAETLENIIVNHFGNAQRRPGTYYVASAKHKDMKCRLKAFQFSTVQNYILEFGHQYIRVFKDSGRVLDASDVVYEISTPYQESHLFQLQFAQTHDIMYIVHKNYAPRKLSRTGHASWSLSIPNMKWGPFKTMNVTDTTMDASAVTGSITITASDDFFTADMIGGYIKMHSGYAKITGYSSATVINAVVKDDFSAHTATADWYIGAWCDEYGWPSCITFYEQRAIYASTSDEPQTLWASRPEEYENFNVDDASDDDGYIYTIASEQVNSIKWLNAGRILAIGTEGGIWNMSSGSDANAITPSNVVVKRETTYGANSVLPKRIGNYVYYIHRNGRTVREFSYTFEEDSYSALDSTLLSEHITTSGIVDMDYQQSPENILWCVRDDGVLATMTRQIPQKVTAWTRQIIGGSFGTGNAVVESVAIIPNGEEDQVWLVVKRTILNETRRHIEYLKPYDWGTNDEDIFFVDCGLTYDGDAATTLTGLGHLPNETVTILADGQTHTTKVVSNEQITLDREAKKVHVGYNYNSTLQTLKLEAGSKIGTSQGRSKRTSSIMLRLYKTLGMTFGTPTQQDRISFLKDGITMGSPLTLFTGDKHLTYPGGWDRNMQIKIIQDQPLPMTILGIFPWMFTADN